MRLSNWAKFFTIDEQCEYKILENVTTMFSECEIYTYLIQLNDTWELTIKGQSNTEREYVKIYYPIYVYQQNKISVVVLI